MTRHVTPRLIAAGAACAILAVAFGIRLAAGANVLDSAGALAQYSGTALYAAMIYTGVYVLFPRTRPPIAAAAALGFCWLIELFQLTGIPAALSARSVLARLALGMTFDPTDLLWYAVGVALAWAGHRVLRRSPSSSGNV